MRISPVSNINDNKIYKNQSPNFQARIQMEGFKHIDFPFPEFKNAGFIDNLKLSISSLKQTIVEEIKKQNAKLAELRISSGERKMLFNYISGAKDPKTYLQVLKSLTGEGTPKKVFYGFLVNRLYCSYDKYSGEFSQEKYYYFNELVELCKNHKDWKERQQRDIAVDLSILVSRFYKSGKVNKNIVNCAKKWLPTKGPLDVECAFGSFGAKLSDELYELGIQKLRYLSFTGHELGITGRSVCWAPFKELYKHLSKEYSAKTLLSLSKLCVNKQGETVPENVDYIKNNKEHLSLIVTHNTNCLNPDNGKFDSNRIRLIKLFCELGLAVFIDDYLDKFPFNLDSEELINFLQEIKGEFDAGKAVYLTRVVTNEDGKVDRDLYESIMRVREFAKQNKELLREGDDEITDEDIDDLLLSVPRQTVKMLSLLGEKTFMYSFKDKFSAVEDYLELFSSETYRADDLIQVINPKNCQVYKSIVERIKLYKNMLKSADDSERAGIIAEINFSTRMKNELLRDAIKDPKEALDLAVIYQSLNDVSFELVSKLIPIMNPKTDEEKWVFTSFLNDSILGSMGIENDYPPQVLAKIDFSKSKYLPQLFRKDDDFSDVFEALLDILAENPDKNNLDIFNNLEQNIETQKRFEELGLNYANWSTFNPESKIQVNVDLSLEQMKESAYKNFEADLNDDLFISLPKEEKNKLIKRFADAGFEMRTIQLVSYDADGFVSNKRPYNRLYKGKELITFDDLKQVIDIFKAEMNENEFWTKRHPDSSINTRKENFKYHILNLRYNEVKNARDKKTSQNLDLLVLKADMNDIQHALFLGNDAGCCTAVDGINGWSAVTYIKNKLISAIEVKDGDKFIGNTMCYIAFVDGELALVLDNIELKSKYQYNDKIRDAIFAYAKKLCAEIGKPELPIYAGPNRHKVNMDRFDFDVREMQIVGSTGEDEIYLDYDAESHQINGDDIEYVTMYRIR